MVKIRYRPRPAVIAHPTVVPSAEGPVAEEGSEPAYSVGKNKPPLHTRFGQPNGNRPGRKPKVDDPAEELEAELQTKISVQIDGKWKRLSKRRLMLRGLVDDAVRRDKAAIRILREFGGVRIVPKQRQLDDDDEGDGYGADDLAMIRALAEEAGLIDPVDRPRDFAGDDRDQDDEL